MQNRAKWRNNKKKKKTFWKNAKIWLEITAYTVGIIAAIVAIWAALNGGI